MNATVPRKLTKEQQAEFDDAMRQVWGGKPEVDLDTAMRRVWGAR